MLAQRFPNAGSAIEFLKRRTVEQKADEPRRKFVEDHQLIHDRKKNEPSIPFLPGHDQEMWFKKLESNGIWNWVFEYLTNPSDVTSAYFSCEMFRKHLEEKRKAILLPKVFEVLQDEGYLRYSHILFDRKREKRREVLKLRLVSKSWKKIAEEVFLVPWKYSVSVSQPIWHPDSWDWWSPMITSFTRIGQIESAMEKLGNSKSCASLPRLVKVKVDDEIGEDEEVFYSKLSQFLDIHGESIWGLRFMGNRNRIDYEKLCQVVSKTPHLKVLELNNDLGHSMWGYFQRETYEELRQITAQTPFPTLPELEFCHLMNYPGATECLTAEILRKSVNLKAVHLDHHDANNRDFVIGRIIWDVLRNLHLEYFNLDYHSRHGNHFMNDFSKLRRCNWPLKFLHIYLYSYHDYFEIRSKCKRILRVMSCFNDTLEEFQFDISRGTLNLKNKERYVVVEFPKLKKFDLSDSIIIRNA